MMYNQNASMYPGGYYDPSAAAAMSFMGAPGYPAAAPLPASQPPFPIQQHPQMPSFSHDSFPAQNPSSFPPQNPSSFQQPQMPAFPHDSFSPQQQQQPAPPLDSFSHPPSPAFPHSPQPSPYPPAHDSSFSGQPPAASFPGQPSPSYPGQPASSFAGQPAASFAGQPSHSYPGQPPNSFSGQPPNSFPGQPPNSFPGQPASSFAGQPPNSFPGQPAPFQAQPSFAGFPPQSSPSPPPASGAHSPSRSPLPRVDSSPFLRPSSFHGTPPDFSGRTLGEMRPASVNMDSPLVLPVQNFTLDSAPSQLLSSSSSSSSFSSSLSSSSPCTPPVLQRQATTVSSMQRLKSSATSIAVQQRMTFGKDVFTNLPPFHLPPSEAPYLLEYDSNVALWLISGARLVYLEAADAEKVARELWEMKEFRFFDIKETDTQAFATCTDDFILVCFRGTESKRDWETNNDFSQVNLNARPCFESVKVHRGFNTALLTALPHIERFVMESCGKRANPSKPLYISGHSLGGALSTLCFAHWSLREQPISVNGVITVGQPRVGTREFVKAMNEYAPCMLQRIFNTNDIVPTVPPTTLGFRHYGTPIYFDRNGRLVRRPSGSKTKLDKASSWISGSGGVAAHNCRLYYDLVINYHEKQNIQQANSAVYKAIFTVHSGIYLKGSSPVDAQIVIMYGDVAQKTPVIHASSNPIWEHVITFPQVYEYKHLSIQAWDVKANKFLGESVIYLDDFTDIDHGEFQLQPRTGSRDSDVRGSLCMSCQYFLISEGHIKETAKMELTIHGARNLFESSSSLHPEARVITPAGLCKRSPPLSGMNPDWNFQCVLPTVQTGEKILLEIWSKDLFLGQAILEIHSKFEATDYASFDLETRRGKSDRVSGKVLVSSRFTPLASDGFPLAKARITVHSASGIKASDRGGTSDPYVQIFIGGISSKPAFQTPVIKKTLTPSWDFEFEIDRLVAGTPLYFVMYDRDRFRRDDFLGQVVVTFPRLTNIINESFSLSSRVDKNDKGICGSLVLSFRYESLSKN